MPNYLTEEQLAKIEAGVYRPIHCSNHLPGGVICRADWVAYELGNLTSWSDELAVVSRSSHEADQRQAKVLRRIINEHAWSLAESERKRSADLAYQRHVAEHWSWNQAPYIADRHHLDNADTGRSQ